MREADFTQHHAGAFSHNFGRKNNAPKHIHIVIPRTCEYVSLYGKKDIVDVIKFRTEIRGGHAGLCSGPDSFSWVLKSRGLFEAMVRRRVVRVRQGQGCCDADPEDGGGDHGRRNAGTSRRWKKHGNGFSPRTPERNTLPTPRFLPETRARLLTYRTIGEQICVVLSH